MDDRLGEILDRLRDLDHRLARLEHQGPRHEPHGYGDHRGHHGHGGHRDHHGHHEHRGHHSHDRHRGGDFDEKRIIDTIVRLTCENLAPIVAEIVARELDERAPKPAAETPPAP